jgi:hypothetical protein
LVVTLKGYVEEKSPMKKSIDGIERHDSSGVVARLNAAAAQLQLAGRHKAFSGLNVAVLKFWTEQLSFSHIHSSNCRWRFQMPSRTSSSAGGR